VIIILRQRAATRVLK
jgi:Ca-activated chloride channel family protein